MISCFGTGNYQHFFNLWTSNIPEKTQKEDLECQKLEFNLHLHFAVFSLVNNTGKLVSCGKQYLYSIKGGSWRGWQEKEYQGKRVGVGGERNKEGGRGRREGVKNKGWREVICTVFQK